MCRSVSCAFKNTWALQRIDSASSAPIQTAVATISAAIRKYPQGGNNHDALAKYAYPRWSIDVKSLAKRQARRDRGMARELFT
jgi:hypothetical protein